MLGPSGDVPELLGKLKRTARDLLGRRTGIQEAPPATRPPERGEARKWKDGVDAALRRLGDGALAPERKEQQKRLKEELANAPNAERRVQLVARNSRRSIADQSGRRPPPTRGANWYAPSWDFAGRSMSSRRCTPDLERDAEVRKALQEVGWERRDRSRDRPTEHGLKASRSPSRGSRRRGAARQGRHPPPGGGNGQRPEGDALIVDPTGETVLPGSLATEIGVTGSAEDRPSSRPSTESA